LTTRRSKLSPFTGAAPMSLTDDSPMDLIFIEGLRADTVIGINTDELHDPQPLLIDLYAGVPRARACDSDRIGDTIDYGVVHTRLHRLLREHKTQLLEAFAEAIADILIDEFGAHWVRVKVVKPRKYDDVDGVGVMIERRASERVAIVDDSDSRTRGATVLQLLGAGMVPGSK
jgi:7,8-dihydroneopterin aldolase/epimerase/oxygenase